MTQPYQPDDSMRRIVFSRWWIIVMAGVFIYGLATLITVTCKAYRDKPPVPDTVLAFDGTPLFTGDDIRQGQQVFLRYGLMDNGTIWGHGAYLGPDFSAAYLHDVAMKAQALAPEASPEELAEVVKTNRYDQATSTLTLDPAQTLAYTEAPSVWAEYFSRPENNGGLPAGIISDPEELRQLSAFFAWSAWASVTNRPGEDYSYTNNFPYEPDLNNTPSTETYVWSVASLIFLLIGIAAIMAFSGRFSSISWNPAQPPYQPYKPIDGMPSSSIRALVKFAVVVGVLLLGQTLVGGAIAHYRADPGSFYGIDLSAIFPSQLVRTWHLQLAIFWIATGFVVGGLVISRILGGKGWKGLHIFTNLLFCAFAIVIFGSLLSDWAGLSGWWDDATFWLGSQGWEYIEIGRAWQLLMIVGFLAWAFVVIRNTLPALRKPGVRPLAIIFLIAAIAVPVFYLPAIFFTGSTNFTVVDTWRFWVIHLWVEGFFEMFATVMVALVFVEIGFVSRALALRIIFLDTILTFMGGIIGTGHHWYFEGQTTFNMAVSSCFSALEVVPLILLALEGWNFMRTSRHGGASGAAQQQKWTLNFFMAVGFWNLIGAGVFGFLINMPIVSYYELGTYLTPTHGHAAMFGVFGFLSLGLCVYVLRRNCTDGQWARVTPWLKCSFWGLNIGLAMMIVFSLLPAGFVQIWDSFSNGYWHARSLEFTGNHTMSVIGWLRMPGDVVFILLGAVPFLVAAAKVWLMKRTDAQKLACRESE